MKANMHFLSYLAHFFLEWEMFQTNVLEKPKTHFVFSNFFSKIVLLWKNMEKFCRSGQTTDDNKAHAHCVLDN